MITPVYCPRCGDALEETHRDYIEGTLCESIETCGGCGYTREWMYGSWLIYGIEPQEDVMDVKMIGMYDHLNKDSNFEVSLGICHVVETIRRMNYGEHRFLSELVRQRKADEKYTKYPEFKHHTDMLESLLNEGYY